MLNKAQVIGNLGQDPTIYETKDGKGYIASFSVATTEKGYTTQNGTQVPDRTEWHNIVCFNRIADIVRQYLHKGSKVFVEGKMRTRSYEDRNGVKRTIMEINAELLEMLDGKPQQQQPSASAQPQSQYSSSVKDDEDLPF